MSAWMLTYLASGGQSTRIATVPCFVRSVRFAYCSIPGIIACLHFNRHDRGHSQRQARQESEGEVQVSRLRFRLSVRQCCLPSLRSGVCVFSEDDTVGDLKKLVAAQTGTRPDKIRIQKWYTIYKDHITLADYEIHDGMGLELYYN